MKTSKTNFSSIILAGGLSSRMGKFKPILSLGEKTMLDHVLLLYQMANIKRISVITGYRSTDTKFIAKKYHANILHNKEYKHGMFSSVLLGLSYLSESTHYFFIHPTDIPLVKINTIFKLVEIAKTKKVDVIYPVFNGKRGHPPLISIALKQNIMNWKAEGGLRQFLKTHKTKYIEVEVPDQAILMDANTPENYKKICTKFQQQDFLAAEECASLMKNIANVPNTIINHCQIVAKIAVILANCINNSTDKFRLNINLINSAALLHDIAKTKKNHAKIGASMMKNLGYAKIGSIIAQHMDIKTSSSSSITEAELIYIADKLVDGSNLVKLSNRSKLRCKNNKIIEKNILHRMENAKIIKKKIETLTSKTIENILGKFQT